MDNIIYDDAHEELKDKSSKDGRSRTWMLLLYPDNEEHKNVLDDRLPDTDWNYAGRIHDMDGKAHFHIVCIFKDGRKKADVAKDLELDQRWLRAWDRKKKAFRYLCHRDDKEKYQYSSNDIFGTCAEEAIKACQDSELSEADAVIGILDILESIPCVISYSDFFRIVCDKGYFSYFRRLGVLGAKLVDEHNAKYSGVV